MIKFTIFTIAIIVLLSGSTLAVELARTSEYQSEQPENGHYYFRVKTSDGITREEEGTRLDEHLEDSPVIVKGSYSYTDATGKVYTVRYTADENGFHPEGDHIQVPSYAVNPNPEKQQAVPVQYNPTTLTNSEKFVQQVPVYNPSTLRPDISNAGNFIQTVPTLYNQATIRPESVTPIAIPLYSSTERPEVNSIPTRIHIPLASAKRAIVKTPNKDVAGERFAKTHIGLATKGKGFSL